MRSIGAHITTTESTILNLVADSSHRNFKEIQRIIKNISADTGLILSDSIGVSISKAKNISSGNDNGIHNKINASL